MTRSIMGLACMAATVALPTMASAQSSRTEALARQWRASRLADLQAERTRIDAEIATLGTALPFTVEPARGDQPVVALIPAGVNPMLAAVQVAPPVAAAGQQPAGAAQPGAPAGQQAADQGEAGTGQRAENAGTDSAPATGRQNFGGLDLGIGLSFTADLGNIDRISKASVVAGTVRVDDQNDNRARIMLESHYFFTPCNFRLFGLRNGCDEAEKGKFVARPKDARWGIGPFVAIQPGTDNIIDAIGMGIMIGARREGGTQSFNLGFGLVVDPDTRVLGDGIIANQPLPMGETDVRYRETSQKGFLILTSFSF